MHLLVTSCMGAFKWWGYSIYVHINIILPHSTDGFPPDGTPIQVNCSYNIWLTILYDLIAVAGLVFMVVCGVLNFIFRNKK